MPALMPTAFTGRITWLGRVLAKPAILASHPVEEMFAHLDGVEGEVHGGATRPSCSRVLALYPRDTVIRNTRQFSVVSAEELAEIAGRMGIERLDPSLVGASLVIEGIPDFTHLPPGSRLQAESGATLVVDMENRPCQLPAKGIEERHPGFGAKFKPAASGRRGVTAWVEREGVLRVGQAVRLFVPDQRPWAHLAEARRG
ncbi:MAG: MOSC domain-containing protein [Paracoccaceae bacterium]